MPSETLTATTGAPDFPFNPHGNDARASAEAMVYNAYCMVRDGARITSDNTYYFWCAYRAMKRLHPDFTVAVTVPSGRYVRVRQEKDGTLLHERGINNIEVCQRIVAHIEEYKMPDAPMIGEQNVWNMGRHLQLFIGNVFVEQEVDKSAPRENYEMLHRLIWDTARADSEVVWRYPHRNGAQLIVNNVAKMGVDSGRQHVYDMDGFGALPRAEWEKAFQVGADTLRELSNTVGGRFRQVR